MTEQERKERDKKIKEAMLFLESEGYAVFNENKPGECPYELSD